MFVMWFSWTDGLSYMNFLVFFIEILWMWVECQTRSVNFFWKMENRVWLIISFGGQWFPWTFSSYKSLGPLSSIIMVFSSLKKTISDHSKGKPPCLTHPTTFWFEMWVSTYYMWLYKNHWTEWTVSYEVAFIDLSVMSFSGWFSL